MHRTHMGVDNDPAHLILQGLKAALADGWGGSTIATELSDVLFGGILLWGTSLAIRACWTRWRLRRWHKLRQIAARKAMT
jgi:hypothetical protein